ncbi:hypothetical protein KL918_004993 [Ogataea parapolymorpha]|nr:hypothetical protein KL918_004993 [Ogataea parapolymorpha]KAG7872197.1 hypothetical protein KL916_003220 [Ogataea parapolymorpha]
MHGGEYNAGDSITGIKQHFENPDLPADCTLYKLPFDPVAIAMLDLCHIDQEEKRFNSLHSDGDVPVPSSTVSWASFQRYKNNSKRVANLLKPAVEKYPNYELVQRLEKLTSKYHTSVPMVISSWLRKDDLALQLNDDDRQFLDETLKLI